MRLIVILFVAVIAIFGGKPTGNAENYLEKGKQLIACQRTGH